jgi:hypothetical protein
MPVAAAAAPTDTCSGGRAGSPASSLAAAACTQCVSQAWVETSTLVRKGYGRNCLHHDLKVLNNPVPPPSTPEGVPVALFIHRPFPSSLLPQGSHQGCWEAFCGSGRGGASAAFGLAIGPL